MQPRAGISKVESANDATTLRGPMSRAVKALWLGLASQRLRSVSAGRLRQTHVYNWFESAFYLCSPLSCCPRISINSGQRDVTRVCRMNGSWSGLDVDYHGPSSGSLRWGGEMSTAPWVRNFLRHARDFVTLTLYAKMPNFGKAA